MPIVPSPPPEKPATARRVWRELLVLYLGSCLVVRGIRFTQESLSLSGDWLVLVALVFI